MQNKENKIVVILHDIRSVENVGSIFRTADAAGVSKIFLSGITPTPLDRFGRKRRDMAKVSLGAEETVLWEKTEDVNSLIRQLKEGNFFIVAIEQGIRAVSYTRVPKSKKIAFVFGNEVDGVPTALLDTCEMIAEIPMAGKKESLNVAVAAGIVLFQYRE
jgi:tRNA G18 (ribose-2'-O)-methylase SpoU